MYVGKKNDGHLDRRLYTKKLAKRSSNFFIWVYFSSRQISYGYYIHERHLIIIYPQKDKFAPEIAPKYLCLGIEVINSCVPEKKQITNCIFPKISLWICFKSYFNA